MEKFLHHHYSPSIIFNYKRLQSDANETVKHFGKEIDHFPRFNIIGNLSQFMVPISPNKIVSHLSKNANVDPL